jgi:[acyl-carrier-protein] S-malonyltransferase
VSKPGAGIRLVLLFPGQGTQHVGMAADLAGARRLWEDASPLLDEDLAEACLSGPPETLTRTLFAQPAIVGASLAAAAALFDALGERRVQTQVIAVAGHSVGELAAMSVAGAFDASTAMHLVVERARTMERACTGNVGGMAAVLGLPAAAVEQACEEAAAEAGEVVEPANYNAADQVVIAGTPAALQAASRAADRLGARRVLPLKVAGPFHSSLMREAAAEFGAIVRQTDMRSARTPVVLNGSARAATTADELRAELEVQIARPVRWSESMARCAELGVDAFVELGPGQTLSGLAKRAVPGVRVFSIQDQASLAVALDGLQHVRSLTAVR